MVYFCFQACINCANVYKPYNYVSDIDECEIEADTCHVNAQCTNTDGNYTCSCSAGYSGDGIMSCSGKDYYYKRR